MLRWIVWDVGPHPQLLFGVCVRFWGCGRREEAAVRVLMRWGHQEVGGGEMVEGDL